MQIAQATIVGVKTTKTKRQTAGEGDSQSEAIKGKEMAATQKIAVTKMLTNTLASIIYREVKVQAGLLPAAAATITSADESVPQHYRHKVHNFRERVRSDITAIRRGDSSAFLTMTEDQKAILGSLASPAGGQSQQLQQLEQQTSS